MRNYYNFLDTLCDIFYNLPGEKIAQYSIQLNAKNHRKLWEEIHKQIKIIFLNDVDGEKIRVYAMNYNVLRIMSGMSGVAYSC